MSIIGPRIRTGDLVAIVADNTWMSVYHSDEWDYFNFEKRNFEGTYLPQSKLCLVLSKANVGSSMNGWALLVFTENQIGWILDLDVYMPLGMSDGS